jgi:hypothetical protein
MPQLEELSLQSATPLAPPTGPFISRPSRFATLPSLTLFYISDFSKECALAIIHLVLPALTRLHVDVESQDWKGEDVRLVIPYVARTVCEIQDIAPLRRMLFSGEGKRAEVVAWAMPEADGKIYSPDTLLSESASARLMFTATGMCWDHEVVTAVYDALFALLHVDSISTFTAQNCTRLSKEFWLNQAPRLPLLERVSLVHTAVKAFRDMLAEDVPPDGPRLPLLTKLTILYVTWFSMRTYHFRDMLLKRVEQGVPLESLDLLACQEPYPRKPPRANQIFAEVVVDVQGPTNSQWIMDERPGRTGSGKEVENYDNDSDTWYGLDNCEEEYVWDDYVSPSDRLRQYSNRI